MKKIAILILLTIPIMGLSQTKSINSFYNQYKHADDVIKFSIPGWIVRFGAKFVDEYPIRHTLKKVKKVKLLVVEDSRIIEDRDYQSLLDGIKEENYELLMQFQEGKEEVFLYGRDDQYYLSHLFLVTKDREELVLISLKGEFTKEDIDLVANEIYKEAN